MTFEENDNLAMSAEPEDTPPVEESSNRTFLIVAGILGAVAIIALVCIVVYGMFFLPRQRAAEATQIALANAQNTQVALAITQTSVAAAFTATPTRTPTSPPATTAPTSTSVVAVATNTPEPTEDPRTPTVAALLTQAASMQTPTSTALPTTGFADEVGIPGLLGLAVLMLVVILLARRLRTA